MEVESTPLEELYPLWPHACEMWWFESAWKHLILAGLAKGNHGKKRCRVALRFLAVAALFSDWCSLVVDDEPEGNIEHFIDALEINVFFLGLMLEPDTKLNDVASYWGRPDGEKAIEHTIRILVRRERSFVAQTLLQGFGGARGLFLSLWKVRYSAFEPGDDQFDPSEETRVPAETKRQSDEEILQLDTPEKLRAWEWITQGCPALDSG